jgi:aspartokinase
MDTHEQKIRVGGIIQNRDLAMIAILAIPDRPGVAGTIFRALGAKGINCVLIVHTIDVNNLDSIVLCIERRQLDIAQQVLNRVQEEVGAKAVVQNEDVGVVSVFGPHFGARPGIAGIMFSALASVDINILAISTSISSLSCIIHASQMDEAVRALEKAFELP